MALHQGRKERAVMTSDYILQGKQLAVSIPSTKVQRVTQFCQIGKAQADSFNVSACAYFFKFKFYLLLHAQIQLTLEQHFLNV